MTRGKVALSPRRLLFDGLTLSVVFSVVVLASLWVNPSIWLEDYPPDVRAVVGGQVAEPVLVKAIVGGVLLVVIVGGLIVTLRRLDIELGGVGAPTVALHTFLMFWIVNAADVVVVDWLFFMTLWRERVILPGTEGLAGYDDYFFHFKSSFLSLAPWIGSLFLAGVMAMGWWVLVIRRRHHS